MKKTKKNNEISALCDFYNRTADSSQPKNMENVE